MKVHGSEGKGGAQVHPSMWNLFPAEITQSQDSSNWTVTTLKILHLKTIALTVKFQCKFWQGPKYPKSRIQFQSSIGQEEK